MDEKDPSGVTQKKLQHYTDIFDGGRLHHTPKRILVHGRPGIGKTVFTQKATFDWSQPKCKGKLGKFDLVLLIRLRDVCNLNDIPAVLNNANLLASDGPVSTDNLYDTFVATKKTCYLFWTATMNTYTAQKGNHLFLKSGRKSS